MGTNVTGSEFRLIFENCMKWSKLVKCVSKCAQNHYYKCNATWNEMHFLGMSNFANIGKTV